MLLTTLTSIFILVNNAAAQVIIQGISVPVCDYSLEIMFLQDLSMSFEDDLLILKVKLPQLIKEIDSKFPQSAYGFASFVDKPIPPLGYPAMGNWFSGDYCFAVDSPLSLSNAEIRSQYLTDKRIRGGRDWAENQLGALLDLAGGNQTGWSTKNYTSNGRPIVRVIVMSTDAVYHIAGDAAKINSQIKPNRGTGHTDCEKEDYPTISQTASALRQRGIYTIMLVGNTTGEPLPQVYNELLTKMGTPGSVHELSEDSSNIVQAMALAFPMMTQRVCIIGAIDVAFVQDVTYSYANDMPKLHAGMDVIIKELQTKYIYPRFGLSTFGDKPLPPLGHGPSGDYCYRTEQNLTFYGQEVVDAASKVYTTSGIDWKESQLDGMISTILDSANVWRTGKTWQGYKIQRIVVLATDSGYHLNGDAAKVGHQLQTHSGGMVQCTGEDYPTVDQLADVLLANDVHPIFVPTHDIKVIYDELNKQLAVKGIKGIVVDLNNFTDLPTAISSSIHRLLYAH